MGKAANVDALGSITSTIDSISENRGSISTQIQDLEEVSLIGMNINKINEVKTKIEDIVENVQKTINNLRTTDASAAFHSTDDSLGKSVESYLGSIATKMDGFASQLNKFCTKLDNAYKAWDESAQQTAEELYEKASHREDAGVTKYNYVDAASSGAPQPKMMEK